MKNKIINLQNITIQHLLIFNIFLYGLIFVTNSIIRFENPIFSCSFWMICDQTKIGWIDHAFLFQFLFSLAGFVTVIGIRFTTEYQKTSNHQKNYIWTIILTVLIIANGVFWIFPGKFNNLLQIFLSVIISINLTVWYVKVTNYDHEIKEKTKFESSLILLTASSLAMILFGVVISVTDFARNCQQFPICFSSDGLIGQSIVVNTHRVLTLTTGIILLYVLNQTWKKFRNNSSLLVPITSGFIVFLGQSLIGWVQVTNNFEVNYLFIHSIGSYIYLLIIFYAASKVKYLVEDQKITNESFFNDHQRRKDYLILNKPIIVALLLVTTYAGMVVGGEEIPSLSLTIWTMIGGALAAGGASAINQYIDRDIDLSMQRTAKRPLPSKRLPPAEALTIGVAEIILSFYIFTSFVNLNAALLAMAGMVYYVFLYSKWLKLITVQNIVIGGGAGAIPPLVGWAAATGGLNVPSLFLFALVFLWTPPHFWALALIRKNDYARANIPMMPVIKGEKETRLQILIYTIQLVLLTLLMPLFGVGGSIYFLLAALLGMWLLYIAWKVYRNQGNKMAFRMYRYSSMYLAFIFLALVVDVLM
ncbi:MAG TPA: heme o synthase [Anaerolineaceae bacterium]|nr:heme o synthase [Anaerolineaceae bacterium]